MNRFPRPVAGIICEYAAELYLLPWINTLLQDPRIAEHARRLIHHIWENPNGLDMAHRENMPISWSNLSANPHPCAIAQLLANPQKINWEIGFGNPGLYSIGREEIDKYRCVMINIDRLSLNSHSECVNEILGFGSWIYPQMMTFEQWHFANMNPNEKMVDYLLGEPFHINHHSSWQNANPKMLEYLFKRLENGCVHWRFECNQIDWGYLSANPNPEAMKMLRESPRQIYWPKFWTNPAIFAPRVDMTVLNLLSI